MFARPGKCRRWRVGMVARLQCKAASAAGMWEHVPRGGFLIFGAGPPAPRGPGGALRPRPMPPCGRMLFMPMGGPWFLGRACSCFFCAGSFFFLVFTG